MNVRYWLSDSIYGINDGLAAIFGIIAGVSGYGASRQFILMSGMFGVIASGLSMAAGAWLAAKSENELVDSERQRQIVAHDEHPEKQLTLLGGHFTALGFTDSEAGWISRRIADKPENIVRLLLVMEHGFHGDHRKRPWDSALFGGISTWIGGMIPLFPLLFVAGVSGFWLAAIVSIIAHFVVGAAKSKVTGRLWWAGGLEMMFAGIIVGLAAYGLGAAGARLFIR